MNTLNYDETIVDCPGLDLRRITLRTVERIVQAAWHTTKSVSFRVHQSDDGRLTVIESLPA